MRRVLVDTNIILDWLAQREEHGAYAERLFYVAEKGKLDLCISTFSFLTTYYILNKYLSPKKARRAMEGLRKIVEIAPAGEQEIDLAMQLDFKDLEDAFQYAVALGIGAQAIITRNQKDFKNAQIPVMNARAFLNA